MMVGLSSRVQHRVAPGPVVFVSLTSVAVAAYAFGFKAAGFAWSDALGASIAHVVPGSLVATVAWRLQPRIRLPTDFTGIGLHLVAAAATAAAWLALMLLVTWIARPEIVGAVLPAAAPGTLISGFGVYAAIATIYQAIERRRRAVVRDAALARAELAALRAKVEPHFLYNTLETISGLVRQQPDAAQEAIMRLGRMLRRVLDEPIVTEADDLVPLHEELLLVRDYLEIERLRMGERLLVVESIEEGVGDLAVPPFMLQTLVENAVLHGIARRPTTGTLSLSAARHGSQLVLVVADDGAGSDEARLEAGGLGLRLLRSRLDAHFSGEARVDIASTPERGTSVRIAIPAKEVE